MNHENHSPSSPPPADPELEARIVAWVAGEAAAAEIAALEHLVAVRPELAVFKRRIEAVHGLVAEAARPDREPLRLSPERRVKLLATLSAPVVGGTSAVAGGATPEKSATVKPAALAKAKVLPMPGLAKAKKKDRQWLFAIAACFVVIGTLGFLATSASFGVKSMRPDPEGFLGSAASGEDLEPEIVEFRSRNVEALRRGRSGEKSKLVTDQALQMPEPSLASAAKLAELKSASEADVSRLRAMAKDESVRRREPRNEAGWADAAAPAGLPNEHVYGALRSSPSVSRQDAARESSAAPASPQQQEEEVILLSPFQTDATATNGYAAATTLAGTRLKTELHDVGSAVSVVTKKFMKDVGATDKKGLLQYTNGREVGGIAGKGDADRPRDNFLAKRKAERPAPMATSASVPPAPAAPSAVGEEKEEVVVLSPFSVASPNDSGFLKANRPAKQAKRPAPAATTAGMGPGALNVNQVLLPDRSDQTDQSDRTIATGKAADKPLAKKPTAPPTADETSAAQEPVSTFSLHVSDASFKLALAALNSGSLPEPASIRPEEFYNAFDYGDPAPAAGEQVSCRVEQSAHPFAQQRNLVRLAVRVPATGRGGGTPLNLTVLLDTSGSMERPDRRAAVRAALATLVGLLGPNDRVTLVGFARQPRLLAEALDGNHANQTLDLLDRTPAEGGTNLEEALKLGSELARRHFAATAQNRIVLLTDGAANLGNADPERLAAAVESLRSQRIAFDACGVGLEGVDDDVLEALTRKGDGRYYVLNSPEAADAGFARQLAGAFRPAAENVKLQVRFNPARVGRYRLVGFEKHRLREEDFRNDAVDAAEISSEEAAVAVYEIEALPQGEGELGEVFVRFHDPTSRTMVERSWTLPFEPRAAAFDRASPSLQLAGTAAALAEKLRGGPAGDRVDLDALAPIVNAQRARRPDDKRIQDLATLFEQLRRMHK